MERKSDTLNPPWEHPRRAALHPRPSDVMGADYPSETFRVLKEGELRSFGEYRMRRLVLEVWDVQERVG